MLPPQGLEEYITPGHVLKLNKSLYGLKQAPFLWHEKVHSTIQSLGFNSNKADPCLYSKYDSEGKINFILLYVDDLIIGAPNHNMNTLEKEIIDIFSDTKITIQDLTYYLGINIKCHQKLISMSQTVYIDSILAKFDKYITHNASGPNTPLPTDAIEFSKKQIFEDNPTMNSPDDVIDDTFPYREIVGSLLYLCTCTRPDLSYSIGFLTRAVCNPRKIHTRACAHLLNYVKSTKFLALLIHGDASTITGFSDASWLNSPKTRKSDHAYIVYAGNAPIIWRFCRQLIVALSTAEAEYDALTALGKEALWLRNLLADIFGQPKLPTILYIDNTAAIRISQLPTVHTNSKHFQLRAHWIRHQVSLGTFTVQHLNTKHLAADAMTKMLTKDQHERHSKFLRGHIPIMHPTTQQWLDIFEGDFKLRLNEYYSLD